MKRVVFDLDVLADSSHRQDYRDAGEWDAYHQASVDDEPVDAMIELANTLAEYADVIVYTERSDQYYHETNQWLVDNGVNAEELYMREAGSRGKAPEIKLELLENVDQDDIWFVAEANPNVVEVLREAGYKVFEVM